MFQEQSYTVDFYHGPFDGHTERLNLQPELLPEHLICYIGPDTLRRINGTATSEPDAITSVVVYAKRRRQGRWMYRFVQAIAPENVSIHPV
jgi:hypothetical protein